MASLKTLSSDIKKAKNNIFVSTEALAKEVAKTQLITLLTNTPVDTGKAISNWQVSLSNSSSSEINPHVKGKQGSTRKANIDIAFKLGKLVIRSKKRKQPIYINNNIQYIELLNSGTISRQPGGFIEKANIAADQVIKKTRFKLF